MLQRTHLVSLGSLELTGTHLDSLGLTQTTCTYHVFCWGFKDNQVRLEHFWCFLDGFWSLLVGPGELFLIC